MECSVGKPSKPPPSVVVLRQSPRLAPAVAAALVGLALTGMHSPAQGAGASFGTCGATLQCPAVSQVATMVLYLTAAFAAIIGLIGIWQLGKRNPKVSPMMPICAFLAACIAAAAPMWATIGGGPIVGGPSSIPPAPRQPIQFQ